MSFTKTRTVLNLLFCVIFMLILGCDSTDHVIIQDNTSDPGPARLAPRNPETYLVYIQPDDPDYHIIHYPCLKDGREIVTEAEALEQGYTPCEVCFPPPPQPVVPKVYILAGSDHYHGMLCPDLDDTKVVIPKAEALERGYAACPICFPQEYVPPPPAVYVMPGSMEYHFMLCPALTDAKEIMLKELALELGYTPHECAIPQTRRIIRRGVRIDRINSVIDPVGQEPDDELIVLKNLDGFSRNIGGWTLSDDEPHGTYTIPDGIVVPGNGTWSVAGWQYNPARETQGLWLNNREETLTLRDNRGNLRDSWSW